jgi:hypothetical protein
VGSSNFGHVRALQLERAEARYRTVGGAEDGAPVDRFHLGTLTPRGVGAIARTTACRSHSGERNPDCGCWFVFAI